MNQNENRKKKKNKQKEIAWISVCGRCVCVKKPNEMLNSVSLNSYVSVYSCNWWRYAQSTEGTFDWKYIWLKVHSTEGKFDWGYVQLKVHFNHSRKIAIIRKSRQPRNATLRCQLARVWWWIGPNWTHPLIFHLDNLCGHTEKRNSIFSADVTEM